MQFMCPCLKLGQSTKHISLNVPPWGSTVVVAHQGQVNLVNTCPIDNSLTIFNVLMKRHDKFLQYLKRSPEPYSCTLVTICQMFDSGDFAEGKCEWLKLFPGRFDLTHTVQLDLWGNEEELFVSRLYSSLETTFTSRCSSPHCPSPVKHVSSKAITLRYNCKFYCSVHVWFIFNQIQYCCLLYIFFFFFF